MINSLKNYLCNPEFVRIIITDLGESVGFIVDKLLRLEIRHLNFQENHTFVLTNELKSFVGCIYEESSKSSVTATLLPVPFGDTVVWYALTCAHVLEMIELSVDYGSACLNFLITGLPKFRVEYITVFKNKPTRIVNMETDNLISHNTIYLDDIRALPRYDGRGGDVAICKLSVTKQLSDYFMDGVFKIAQSQWINSTQLQIEKYTDVYKRNKISINYFH